MTDLVAMSAKKFTDEGYLVVEANLARSGIQEYLAMELGMPPGFDNPNDIVKVYRPPNEVFKPESMQSFALKPVTNDHPPEMVSMDNLHQFLADLIHHLNKFSLPGANVRNHLGVFYRIAGGSRTGIQQNVSLNRFYYLHSKLLF